MMDGDCQGCFEVFKAMKMVIIRNIDDDEMIVLTMKIMMVVMVIIMVYFEMFTCT